MKWFFKIPASHQLYYGLIVIASVGAVTTIVGAVSSAFTFSNRIHKLADKIEKIEDGLQLRNKYNYFLASNTGNKNSFFIPPSVNTTPTSNQTGGTRLKVSEIPLTKLSVATDQQPNELLEVNLQVEPLNDSIEIQFGSFSKMYSYSSVIDSSFRLTIPWGKRFVQLPLPFRIVNNRIMINFVIHENANQLAMYITNNKVYPVKIPGTDEYYGFYLAALRDRLEIRDRGNMIAYSIYLPNPNKIVFQGTYYIREYDVVMFIGQNGVELANRDIITIPLAKKLLDSLQVRPIWDFTAMKPLSLYRAF